MSCNNSSQQLSTVYFTQEISPASLQRIFHQLDVKPSGRVAVKISTGEPGGHNFLNPQLIAPLVQEVNGTIVECNTAYGGGRSTTELHLQAARDHGFCDIAPVEIMDAEGETRIPVRDTTYIKYDIVGAGLEKYDFMINLAHFKGHTMGGFGGVLKNASIGVASANGKAYIHSTGQAETVEGFHAMLDEKGGDWVAVTHSHDIFHECMATAAAAVHDHIPCVYINVMNNLSVSCDCEANPAEPEMANVGILASLDPVALDQACVDLVFHYPSTEDDNAAALIERINSRHGIHTIEHAAAIGLGNRQYNLVSIDGDDMLEHLNRDSLSLVVRHHGVETTYTQHGVRDLYELVVNTGTLKGAAVADKVIGKGAAYLLVKGGARFVTTNTISKSALEVLQNAGVEVSYTDVVDHIVNHAGTDECPLEKRLKDVNDVEKAMKVIADFVLLPSPPSHP